MANCFSKKYGNKGLPFNYLRIKDATSLPQEQAAKTDMLSVVSIQVWCTVEEGVANACI